MNITALQSVISSVLVLAQCPCLAAPAQSACEPSWVPTFGGASGLDASVRSLAVYDDGSGPALYAGGTFTTAFGPDGAQAVDHIVRWDGSSWSPLGGGFDGTVHALTVLDDGGGPALYAAGEFAAAGGAPAAHVARWDGAAWTSLGGGTNGAVYALAVFDGGGGPALYAGGEFTSAGGLQANHVAKWDGSGWSALGAGVSGGSETNVYALAGFDDGTGPALYAGGSFTSAGGVGASRIAKWDGSTWSNLGSGLSGCCFAVQALAVFDDGTGPALFAGGWFDTAGGVAAPGIAKWDGSSWSSLGGGLYVVYSLAVFDDGTGPALYAGGAGFAAQWDGATWSSLDGWSEDLYGAFDMNVVALTVFDDGPGQALYAGAEPPVLVIASDEAPVAAAELQHIVRWDGESWSALGDAVGPVGVKGTVEALTVFDGGEVPLLVAAGAFDEAGGVSAQGIAAWDGASWSPLGSGIEGVLALASFDDGTGPALYAGGDFATAGGVQASNVARWDGLQWSALGRGTNGVVAALVVFDDGSGPALYAGGAFTLAGGQPALHVARWDGSQWSAVGSESLGSVTALCAFENGTGPVLAAAYQDLLGFGWVAAEVAAWDGVQWSVLGSFFPCCMSTYATINALAVFDSGTGPVLYVGGDFLGGLAAWDGAGWVSMGGGGGGGGGVKGSPWPFDPWVSALAAFDDGSGAALYVGGLFETAGGVPASNIARWDGTDWSPLASGILGSVNALAAFDHGSAPGLYCGGSLVPPDSGDPYLARWGCPSSITVLPGCFGNPAQLVALTEAAVGEVLDLKFTGMAGSAGHSLLFLGADGTDPGGCGWILPGFGEALLAPHPTPLFLASEPTVSGVAIFSVAVPEDAALVGLTAFLQAAGAVHSTRSIELSTALAVTLLE